jgi:hypothetical protein
MRLEDLAFAWRFHVRFEQTLDPIRAQGGTKRRELSASIDPSRVELRSVQAERRRAQQ